MINKLKRMIIDLLLYRPLPGSTLEEDGYIEELKKSMRELPEQELANDNSAEDEWKKFINRLKELALEDDVRRFLRWDVIVHTMFVSNAKFVKSEFKYLKSLPNWKNEYRKAIKESIVGYPKPYVMYPVTSGNLIHHAYHIAKFEENFNSKIKDVDVIFEFGGGYGSMCRLCRNLGFNGKYIIFDLPQFTALQKYYLKTLGFNVSDGEKFNSSDEFAVSCISDYQKIKTIIETMPDCEKKMFIATWSISESPIDLRAQILPLISDFDMFLIAYQQTFHEINNREYFSNWKDGIENIEWNDWGINHLNGSRYLMGKKKL